MIRSIQEVFLHDCSTSGLREVAGSVSSEFVIVYLGSGVVRFCDGAAERFVNVARDTGADMVYSDWYDAAAGDSYGGLAAHPAIDCQPGALRDDFDFGKVLVFRTSSFVGAVREMENDYRWAGLYDLRLRMGKIVHISERLYSYDGSSDLEKGSQGQFAYVDPKNRAVQIEMEAACTAHLKRIGAWLPPVFKAPDSRGAGMFAVRASVVIPVFNRVRTIADAVRSAMGQVCDFPFNVIVIDNYSTDGTSELLAELQREYNLGGQKFSNDLGTVGGVSPEAGSTPPQAGGSLSDVGGPLPKLEVIVPKTRGHGIGGCWNEAVFSGLCGEFCVQLDSDDLYSGTDTLQRIVDGLREQDCAMLIGSYALTDFDLNPIPPGVIDHREWTEDNGRNNALRINGLGAPRAFCTSVLREVGGFPDVSYGEDYAVGLRISREWRIGRIYDVLYLCRRWGGNSDSNLTVERQNANNLYKDRLRTEEMQARIALNLSRVGAGGGCEEEGGAEESHAEDGRSEEGRAEESCAQNGEGMTL